MAAALRRPVIRPSILTAVRRPAIEHRINSLRSLPQARTIRPLLVLATLTAAVFGRADPNVIVTSTATPEYTRQKYGGEKPKRESYVVMQGNYFSGGSVDHSVERMPFRRIMEVFAPELGRREYFPAQSEKDADLLIVVHWGTTEPRASMLEMTARTSSTLDTSGTDFDRQIRIAAAAGAAAALAELVNNGARLQQEDAIEQISDQVAVEQSSASIAQLLGYTKELRKLGKGEGTTADEYTLRMDLRQERYFVILKAYDLRVPALPGRPRPTVWTMHLNMSSPGNNFGGAVARMSAAAVNFVGRTTERVETLEPNLREGKVEVGPLTIVPSKK